MKNPMRIHACGHTFCDKCAPSKGKCPSCNTKIKDVYSKDLSKIIRSFIKGNAN
jgi:hypothetical protein